MYLGLKTFHVISVIAWMAGLFYIFRLYVYHVKYRQRAGVPETLAEMERKLLRAITVPASVTTVLSGTALIWLGGWWGQAWLWGKLASVAGLFAYQQLALVTRRRFLAGDYWLSERSCRMINEIPMVFLIAIAVLVIFKPFG